MNYNYYTKLKLLPDNKVKLALRTAFTTPVWHIKPITPVNSKQTEHRQPETNANTCRSFQIKYIKLVVIVPTITSLKET